MDVDQKEGQRGKALLPINDELVTILVANNDGPEEVVAVLLYRTAFVALLVALQELFNAAQAKLEDLAERDGFEDLTLRCRRALEKRNEAYNELVGAVAGR